MGRGASRVAKATDNRTMASDGGGSAAAESRVAGPLVGTKLRAPVSVSGCCERPRLSGRLDAALGDHVRLTVLSAPPGYGKTVAVAGWLEARRVPRAWLALDAAENDLARFVRYLAAALRTVRPDVGGTLDLFGPGTTPTPDLVGAVLLEGWGPATSRSTVWCASWWSMGRRSCISWC